MSTKSTAKKSTTRKTSTKKSEQEFMTPQEARADLARHLAAILDNAETPRGLFDAIADECQEWQNERDNDPQTGWRSAPFIADCLEAYASAEAKRTEKGGTN